MRQNTEADFWERVEYDPVTECLNWTGRKFKGYGRFDFLGDEFRAHRLAWSFVHGEIPTGLHVCHTCDNPACINISHLWLGTQADNMADMTLKGRSNPPCLQGSQMKLSKLTEAQVIEIRHLYDIGRFRQFELCKMYDISRPVMHKIVKRKAWTHI